MAAGYNQLIMRWKDVNGLFCTNFFCTQNQNPFSDESIQAVASTARQISDCGLQFIQFQQTIAVNAEPTTGPYDTVYDRAVFLDRGTAGGQYGQMQIPGPKQSIFNSDNLTINLNDPNVSAFVAAAIGALSLPPNNALVSVYAGKRSRVRTNQA